MKKNSKIMILKTGVIATFNVIIIIFSGYIRIKYKLSEELSDILMFLGIVSYNLGVISCEIIEKVNKKNNKKNNLESIDN